MTVIARFQVDGFPVLMGDLLISGPHVAGSPAITPTADDLSSIFGPGSSRVSRGLCQKVAILADNLIVGWAGDMMTARVVLTALAAECAARPQTWASVKRFFDDLGDDVWKKIGIVGYVRDNDASLTPFCCDATIEFDSPAHGTVALLGTGTKGVQQMLTALAQLPEILEGSLNPLQRATGVGLQLSGSLLGLEITTLQSLEDLYGGGYELATLVGGKFAKVDDILYLFWRASVQNDAVCIDPLPVRVCRYSYHNSLLFVRSVAFDRVGLASDEKLFCVAPVHIDPSDHEVEDAPKPTLNARFLCNYFVVRLPGNAIGLQAMVHAKKVVTDRKWVDFHETPTTLVIGVDADFIAEVSRVIASRL